MKSEERQKLAKERREEKAKYFSKYSRSKVLGTCCAGGELPLVVGWKQVVVSFACVKSGGTPGHHLIHIMHRKDKKAVYSLKGASSGQTI